MQRDIPKGLGGGLAATLLILSVVTGSGLGFVLALFAALPITLVTLCWGYRAGLVAALTSMTLLTVYASVVLSSNDTLGSTPIRLGLEFGVATGLPAWGLAYLAIAGFDRNADGAYSDDLGRISLGTLTVVAAILSAASAFFAILSFGSSYSDAVANLEQEVTSAYRIMANLPAGQPIPPIGGVAAADFLHAVSRIALPFTALTTTALSLCGLWLAANIARISGLLPRPWPDVAAQLRMPRWSLGLLAVSLVLALLPDLVGLAGQLILTAMLGGFIVQGFATVHYLSRGNSLRPMILTGVYVFSFFPATLAIAWSLLTVLGLIDTIFDLRDRFGGRPKSSNITPPFK